MDAPVHAWEYRRRRALNWFPLGIGYALLYFGRYNLNAAKSALGPLMPNADFGDIFGVGAWMYGCSFLLTGPITDMIGGRRAMLLGTAGAILANLAMALACYGVAAGWDFPFFWTLLIAYAVNMHFQSYGAIAIVTAKAPWFHVRERGTFSTIFGAMIALGLYFAFDWGYAIVDATRATFAKPLNATAQVFHGILGVGGQGVDANWWVFLAPAICLTACGLVILATLRNRPSDAGFPDIDTGEASLRGDAAREPMRSVLGKIITHPVLIVVIAIEFCSGVLRNGTMHWYPLFAKTMGFKETFPITAQWGLTLLLAGVAGALLTGWASDRFFASRRAPMAAILYGAMAAATFAMVAAIDGGQWPFGLAVALSQMAVIGVHGILSGTATADFAGTKNSGAATGVVDGFVYLGTGLQSFVLGRLIPDAHTAPELATNPDAWVWWPIFLLPFTLIGLTCAWSIRHAVPGKRAA